MVGEERGINGPLLGLDHKARESFLAEFIRSSCPQQERSLPSLPILLHGISCVL